MEYFDTASVNRLFNRTKTFVFDMNGLIVDDEAIQLDVWNRVLAPRGIHITEKQWISNCVGRKPMEFLPEIIRGKADEKFLELAVKTLIAEKDRIYSDEMKNRISGIVRDGFMEFLNYLVEQKCKLAVATSTTRAGVEDVLGPSGLNVLDKFDVVVCGDEVKKSKPNPEIYRKVSKHFSNGQGFAVFEDTNVGVVSAKNAGMLCVAVPNKYTAKQDFSAADCVLSDLTRGARIMSNVNVQERVAG